MISLILRLQNLVVQFFQSLFSLAKVLVWSKFGNSFPKIHQKNAVILGNGPSLNDSLANHLDFIKQSDIFCVNLFAISPFYTQLKPNNYLLLDDAFLDINHERASLAIKHLVADTTWAVNLYVPYKFKKSHYFIENISKNSNLKPFYFNYVIFEGYDWLRFWIYKQELAMPQCQNVLVALLFRCINLGYEQIYLLGADHTWHETLRLNQDNKLILTDTHFYGQKDYDVGSTMPQNKSYLAAQFLSLHKAFKGYEVLARYAKHQKTKIINASERSYVDVFEKIKL